MRKAILMWALGCVSVFAQCPNEQYVYVTPDGTGTAPGPVTTLQNALTMPAGVGIRLAVGLYTLNNPLVMTSGRHLEGGYDPVTWNKSSNGITDLYRTNSNTEAGGPFRLTAVSCVNISNFSLRDMTIRVQDADVNVNGHGVSTYGVYMRGCSNYDLARLRIIVGRPTDGRDGIDGQNGRDGAPGAMGGEGCRRCEPVPPPSLKNNFGGAGGLSWSADFGGIARGGNGGNGGSYAPNTQNTLAIPLIPTGNYPSICNDLIPLVPAQDGEAGSAEPGLTGGAGGNAGNDLDFVNDGTYGIPCTGPYTANMAVTAGDFALSIENCDFQLYLGGESAPGNAGTAPDGIDGADGVATFSGGFFVPGDGQNGTRGMHGAGGGGGGGGGAIAHVPLVTYAGNTIIGSNRSSPGGGGGGGGEGGEGGGGGIAGTGGGGTFGIFLWDNGAGGAIRDCFVNIQPPSVGGQKSFGKPGGQGGAGGPGGFDCAQPGCAAGCEGGRGGNGSQGQNGGRGGDGGKGADGQAAAFYQNLGPNPVSPSIFNQFVPTPAVSVQSTGCYNSEIFFSISNPSPTSVYSWAWADGSSIPLTATGPTATFVFVSGGYKTLVLTVDGIPYQYTYFLDLDARCSLPQILNAPTSGAVCAGASQTLTAATDDGAPILEQQWTVTGPGNYNYQSAAASILFPPAGQNLELGTYKVMLRVRTACGGWSVDTSVTLQILPLLEINVSLISLSERTGCAPLAAALLATTLNAGEGATLTWKKRNAAGIVSTLGTFPVLGGSQIYEGPVNNGDVVFVELNSDYPCAAPASDFTSIEFDYTVYPRPTVSCPATTITQELGGTTTLTGGVSGGTPPYTYTWNLGNGMTKTGETNQNSISETVSFGGSGTYNVTLSVVDANGCTAGPCDNPIVVTVTEIPATYESDFSATPRESCGTLTATFTATVSQHFPNPQFIWEFGDGTQQTTDVPTVTHEYTQSGSYTVTLIVRNAQGQILNPVVKTSYIVVYPPPSVQITTFGETSCAKRPIRFAASGENVSIWEWNLNGETRNEPSPRIFFDRPGLYTISLRGWTTNPTGEKLCYDDDQTTVLITERPRPAFIVVNPSSLCEPATVNFTDLSQPREELVQWHWDFGDGNVAYFDSDMGGARHTYEKAGVYTVRLRVVNTDDCDSTFALESAVRVAPQSRAMIAVNGENWYGKTDTVFLTIPKTKVLFSSASENAETFRWQFEGATPSEALVANPDSVDFPQKGRYAVDLTVRSADGCLSTHRVWVSVREPDVFGIPNVFTPNNDGLNDLFKLNISGYEYKINVYNRWGHRVFSGDQDKLWNGGYDNDLDRPCPEGVYFYNVDGKHLYRIDYTFSRKGSVTILR